MTKEELLKPRYKVIEDYPFSCLPIGYVVDTDMALIDFQSSHTEVTKMEYLEKFPAIFRRLEWWQDRKPEDMPEHVKCKDDENIICKVEKWDLESTSPWFMFLQGDVHPYNPVVFLPATEAEYQAFINPLPAEPGDK